LRTSKKNLLKEDDLKPENIKARITIYVDLDVLKKLKTMAAKQRVGYQTLLNQKLRSAVLDEHSLHERLTEIEKRLKIID